jgi:hypothetical protein
MRETFRVGDQVPDARAMDAYPTGTVIRERRRTTATWSKLDNALWLHSAGGTWRADDFNITNMVVVSFPSGAQTFELPAQTVEQVKWKYRTGALAAAHSHGVSVRAVEAALVDMGAGVADLQLGRGVRVSEVSTRDSLPENSIVYSGAPQRPDSLSVWAKKNGRWVHILGERTYLEPEVTIESYGGNRERPAWLDREGTEEDAVAIKEFKARAWRVGYNLKRNQGWCGTYEDIARRLGVTEAALADVRYAGVGVGEQVDRTVAGRTPTGTILYWRHRENPDRWAVFLRTDQSAITSRTVRVAFSDTDENVYNSKTRMIVAAIGDENDGRVSWDLPDWLPMERLPVGTVLSFDTNGGEFVIAQDRRFSSVGAAIIPDRGTYQLSQFGANPQWRIRRFIR